MKQLLASNGSPESDAVVRAIADYQAAQASGDTEWIARASARFDETAAAALAAHPDGGAVVDLGTFDDPRSKP